MSVWSQPPGVSGDWSEGIWRFSVWDQPGLLSQQRWDQDTNVHHPQEGRKERLPHLVWNQSTPLTNTFPRRSSMSPKCECCFIWGLQLICWMLLLATQCHTHYRLHPFYFMLFKFKYLVAKPHQTHLCIFQGHHCTGAVCNERTMLCRTFHRLTKQFYQLHFIGDDYQSVSEMLDLKWFH